MESATIADHVNIAEFIRGGPLLDIHSYPVWAQDMVTNCASAKARVVNHVLFCEMRDAKLSMPRTRAFLIGTWPTIEQFPQYMAMNLIKARYGIGRGQDMARRYLIRNIRVEQNHAEQWVDWAAAVGMSIDDLSNLDGLFSAHALSHWCWEICDNGDLPTAVAATNYAIEGATGEWTALVCSTGAYEESFEPDIRKKGMKWLKSHAQYDDTHPWEALDTVCTILGHNPKVKQVSAIEAAIKKSYYFMGLNLDACMGA